MNHPKTPNEVVYAQGFISGSYGSAVDHFFVLKRWLFYLREN